jgi:sugar-specific transcriptional regulator TrmB
VKSPSVCRSAKHLKVLSDAGLIEVEAIANRRVCSLRPEPFQDMDDWLKRYRQLWEDRFDRLDTYLQELQKEKDTSTPTQDPEKPSGGTP